MQIKHLLLAWLCSYGHRASAPKATAAGDGMRLRGAPKPVAKPDCVRSPARQVRQPPSARKVCLRADVLHNEHPVCAVARQDLFQ